MSFFQFVPPSILFKANLVTTDANWQGRVEKGYVHQTEEMYTKGSDLHRGGTDGDFSRHIAQTDIYVTYTGRGREKKERQLRIERERSLG